MPEPVAQGIEAAVVVARAQLVVGVEVGDVGELGVLQAAHHAMVARRLDRAEQLAQAQQAVIVERLIVKDQHGVTVDGVVQRLHGLRRQRAGEIDAGDLAGEQRMQLTHLDHRLLRFCRGAAVNGCAIDRRHPCR